LRLQSLLGLSAFYFKWWGDDQAIEMAGRNHSHGWGKVTCMGLAETTALLRMLNGEPDPPAENPLPTGNAHFESQRQTRVLTLKHERDLVDNLAFLLSAFGDDPKRVIAVCVEESWGGDSMTVRMAMNAGDMVMVTEGLRKMTRVLEQEAAQGLIRYPPLSRRFLYLPRTF
jgi:hypothetical protein